MIVSDDRVPKFVSERLNIGLCPPYVGLGLERDGKIVAGVVLNCFEGDDVHVTVAGEGWTRDFFRRFGEYVFEQLGCGRITAITADDQVAGYGVRLGGKIEGCLREHFGPGRDGLIIGILRREWRYGRQ